MYSRFFKKKTDKKINDDNPHYVKWWLCGQRYYDIEEFRDYEKACEFVRTRIYDTDLDEDCGLPLYNWMIIDLFTLEITNYEIHNGMYEFYHEEEEYKNEFALAINKVLASKAFTTGLGLKLKEKEYKKEFALAIEKVLANKAFTLGLALKLSMRNCGFDLS
jgi:hypothetical protein